MTEPNNFSDISRRLINSTDNPSTEQLQRLRLRQRQRPLASLTAYSDAIHTSYESPLLETQTMDVTVADEMRTEYLRAMQGWEAAKNQERRYIYLANDEDEATLRAGWETTWASFNNIVGEIEQMVQELGHDASPTGDFMIRINNRNYEFHDVPLVTIGRIQFTDIPLSSGTGTSRLHAIVRLFGDKLVVMDVGSYSGINCLERSGDGPCLSSVDGARRPLVFDKTETIKLQLGELVMVISPKTCAVCLTNTRSYLGNCGHYVLCEECSNRIIQDGGDCPICRRSLVGPRSRLGALHAMSRVREY